MLKYYANLCDLINSYFPWNHQTAYEFLMIAGGVDVN